MTCRSARRSVPLALAAGAALIVLTAEPAATTPRPPDPVSIAVTVGSAPDPAPDPAVVADREQAALADPQAVSEADSDPQADLTAPTPQPPALEVAAAPWSERFADEPQPVVALPTVTPPVEQRPVEQRPPGRKRTDRQRTDRQRADQAVPREGGAKQRPGGSPRAVVAGRALAVARRLSGIPYVWGGTSTAGFDCSGYTQHVFATVGIRLPRTAAQQQRAAPRVTRPQIGDLVFVGTPAHHVGIFAGPGLMYDAPRRGRTTGLHRIWSANLTYGRPVAG